MHVHIHVLQGRGVELVIAFTQVHHHFVDAAEALGKAHELQIHRAVLATERPALGRVLGVEVAALGRMAARKHRQHALVQLAQNRFDGRGPDVDRRQGHREQLDRDLRGQDAHTQLGPDVRADGRLQAQVEQVGRATRDTGDEPGVQHHGDHFRGADFAIAQIAHLQAAIRLAQDLPIRAACDRGGLDVVEVGIDLEGDGAAQARSHAGNTQTTQQTQFQGDTEFGFFLAAGACLHSAIFKAGQCPVVEIEAVDHVQRVVRVERTLDAVGVVAEGQVRIGVDTADRANDDVEPSQRWEWDRDFSQDDIEAGTELQQWQFVREQGRVAATEDLGPVADVRHVRQELQTRTGCRTGGVATRGLGRHQGHAAEDRIELVSAHGLATG